MTFYWAININTWNVYETNELVPTENGKIRFINNLTGKELKHLKRI
ncbi:hypothetical protein [Bacillus mycoides]|nr:hypothetical protein B4083_1892 [Bacillus cereus]